MEQNKRFGPTGNPSQICRVAGGKGENDLVEILENTPRGPWEPLLGVICLRLARGPGCRSELGIPWKPPKSSREEAENSENNTKLLTVGTVAHAHPDLCRLVAAIGG